MIKIFTRIHFAHDLKTNTNCVVVVPPLAHAQLLLFQNINETHT